jgi:hypothetical protein
MKNKILVLGLAFAILFGMEFRNRAEADTKVSFNVFFDALAPYGNWVSVPEYGYAWYPYGVGSSWRPYSYGRWSWSDYGWIWVSDEPWGWATYHYGRWVFDDYYGWLWLPGTVWSPAWVTWFTGPSYIGWAPLPPDYDFFYSDYGYYGHRYKHRHHHYHHHYVKPSHCVFVPSHHFLHHNVHSVALNPSRNVTIIKNTNKVTNIKLVNNKLVNYGPSVSLVEKSTRTKIRKVNVVDSDLRVIRGGRSLNKQEDREYRVYRPKIVKEGNEAPVIKKDINRDTLQIDKKRGNIAPYKDQEKSLKKKETSPSYRRFEEPDGQEYRINPAKKGNLVETHSEKNGIPKNKKSTERDYSRKPSIKAGASFVSENENKTGYAHTYSNGGYPAYRKGKKEDPVKTRDLIKAKKVEKASYKPGKFNESNEYKRGNEKTDRIYKNDSKKNSEKNWNRESRVYQPNKRTFNNQSSLRKGPRGIRH